MEAGPIGQGLSLPEAILLLALDDETGEPVGRRGMAAGLALAAAVLMELALAGRLDTDLERLEVAGREATGDAVLDAALARLPPGAMPSAQALTVVAGAESGLRAALLDGLVARGLLRRQEGRFLWVFPDRRYPKSGGREAAQALRARLREVVLEDGIPEPREALLIGLARASGLLPLLFGAAELAAAAPRLEAVFRLEALNRSLGAALGDLYAARLRAGSLG